MKDTVILCTSFGMGHSKQYHLPLILIEKYLTLLLAGNELPAAICFYTDGVQLVTSMAPEGVMLQLKMLEAKGVRLIACSTCLDTMGMTNDVKVGIIGGMPDILEAQTKASKVITI